MRLTPTTLHFSFLFNVFLLASVVNLRITLNSKGLL